MGPISRRLLSLAIDAGPSRSHSDGSLRSPRWFCCSPRSAGNGEDATPTVTTIVVDHTELESYGAEIAAVAARLAELTERGTAINTAWDDRTEEFQTTLTALRALESQAAALPDLVSDLTAPEVIGVPTHQRLVNSAQTFANAASEMVDGLRAPDTGDARRAALKKFEAAAVEFATLTGGVEQAVGSLSDLSTD